MPPVRVLVAVCRALDLPVDFVLADEPEPVSA